MANPYAALPDHAFWRRAVADRPASEVDPVAEPPFSIHRTDKVASLGSCFARHVGPMLTEVGFSHFCPEPPPALEDGRTPPSLYSAAFGEIYSVRQLLQLFERAFGLFRPTTNGWQRADGRFVDAFRPRMFRDGFPTLEAMEDARRDHLARVRVMFQACDVLVFTLGLTEAWVAVDDGAVVPLAPGVVGGDPARFQFVNFSIDAMLGDFEKFVRHVQVVNPSLKIILTVSPVPLVATYEPRHVLVSNTVSKAMLRVVADQASRSDPIAYFPAYEIIAGPQGAGRYFERDLRSVSAEGLAVVTKLFRRHFLSVDEADAAPIATPGHGAAPDAAAVAALAARYAEEASEICDEEAQEPTRLT